MLDFESVYDHRSPGRPLRVARILSGLWPGGVEKKLTMLLPELNRNLFELCVICLKTEGQLASVLREKRIPVYLQPVRSRWSPSGLYKLSRFLKNWKVDIVHTHMYRSNVTGTVAARLAGVPVVIGNIHNIDSWDNSLQIAADRLVSRWRDCTIFVSEGVRQNYLEKVRLAESAQKVLYNGVDTSQFSPISPNARGLLNGNIIIGFAARLMPQKQLDFLVRAAGETDLQNAGVHIYIAGDGPLKDELLSIARKTGAEDYFHLMGFQNDMPAFYRALDVFAMPSIKEGFSNALLEAMACGVPPVATAVGGNPEAVQEGVSGLLVPPSDYAAFIEALRTLVLDPAKRKRMACAAAERAASFSLVNMVRQTEELYWTLWSEKAKL